MITEAFNENWQIDKELALERLEKNGFLYQYLSQELRDDDEILLKALEETYKVLEFANVKQKSDFNIVLAAIKQSPAACQFVEQNIMDTEEIVLEIARNIRFSDYFNYVSERLKNDVNFCLACAKENKNVIKFFKGEAKDIFDSFSDPVLLVEKFLMEQKQQELLKEKKDILFLEKFKSQKLQEDNLFKIKLF
jgi:hypothetical protein